MDANGIGLIVDVRRPRATCGKVSPDRKEVAALRYRRGSIITEASHWGATLPACAGMTARSLCGDGGRVDVRRPRRATCGKRSPDRKEDAALRYRRGPFTIEASHWGVTVSACAVMTCFVLRQDGAPGLRGSFLRPHYDGFISARAHRATRRRSAGC